MNRKKTEQLKQKIDNNATWFIGGAVFGFIIGGVFAMYMMGLFGI